MTKRIYVIRDMAAEVFMTPTIESNDETAMRNFAYAIHHSDGLYNFKPKDFAMYYIGDYDTGTGVINPVSPVELICYGDSLIEKE